MRIGAFLWALWRRMFRRPGFLAVLALIPVLTGLYAAAGRQEAAMVTVALAREDGSDALAGGIMAALTEESEILQYVVCHSPQEAMELVKTGKCDAAWVFHAGTQENILKFIRTRSERDAFLTCYQREETVLLRLSRERLNAGVYTAIARELYLQGLTQASGEMEKLTQEEKLRFWAEADIPGELFAYSQAGKQTPDAGYLLSPLRGLLAVVVLLGSLSMAMYHSRDALAGTFGYLSWRMRWLPELAGGLLSSLVLSAGMGLALALAGLTGSAWRELICLLGLALGCTGFSMAVRRLLPGQNAMAAVLPVAVVLGLLACPVFFSLETLMPLGMVLPVSHYLRAVSGAASPVWLLVYSGVCFAVALIPKRENERAGITHPLTVDKP